MKMPTMKDQKFAAASAGGTAPFLVDFSAAWCGLCPMLSPVLDEVAAEPSGRTVIAKLNFDESPRVGPGVWNGLDPDAEGLSGGQPVRTRRGLPLMRATPSVLAGILSR